MENEIKNNLVYLIEHLTNLEKVLLHLLQSDIISSDERETILCEKTSTGKNTSLWLLIQKKDWEDNKDHILEILRKTKNGLCANTIEGIEGHPDLTSRKAISHPKLPKSGWWPEKKLLIKSLHKRKVGDQFLVEILHEKIQSDENRMVVIFESANASKLTGMGGIGKTLTAKWYAHAYEEEYDNILWIDCGEGRLLQSFSKLARDLDVKNRNELLEVEELSRKSYEELEDSKCLLIFDNAENYQGKEGILKVLPKYQRNFYCVITSRFREWGDTQLYGKITDLQLDTFSDEESISFLENNLNEGIERTQGQLRELSKLLGNLPLALQLAAAALNNEKINLQTYIEKTSAYDAEKIVNEKFGDYEKKINMNVEISLDLIAKDKNGKLARKILLIFGYVSPDDIPIEFFEEVLHGTDNIFKRLFSHITNYRLAIANALELLLKYSLITMKEDDQSGILLSIHRLLQQVIRLHGRASEKKTIRRILGCSELFTDMKLVPFVKYADEDLQKEFPKVKAELLDQKQLLLLVCEERFEDAAQLSGFIHKEINTNTSLFNYAICLEKNDELEKSKRILEELHEKDMEEQNTARRSLTMGILELQEALTKDLVAGYLFVVYWKMGNKMKVKEFLENNKENPLAADYSMKNIFLQILNSDLISSNYSLDVECSDQNTFINLKFNVQTKIIKLSNCFLDSDTKLPNDLQELELYNVEFKDVTGKTMQSFDLKEFLPLELNRLKIHYGNRECILLFEGIPNTIEYLSLKDCSLSLDPSNRISPNQLRLEGVAFIRNGEKQETVKINDFIDFRNLKIMIVDGGQSNLIIDFGDEFVSLDYLELQNIEILNWKEAKWTIRKLRLQQGIPFIEKTNMKIIELVLLSSSLDISSLPLEIELLVLGQMTQVVRSGGCGSEIDCPGLNCLQLVDMSSSCLSLFKSINLTHVYFYWTTDLDVNLLPESVEEVAIWNSVHTGIPIVGGPRKIKRLTLGLFGAQGRDEVLLHFQPNELFSEDDGGR